MLSKIHINQVKKHIEKIIHPDQVDFITRIDDCLYIYTNKFILIYKNRLKERNYMIILIHAEKALEKVQPL